MVLWPEKSIGFFRKTDPDAKIVVNLVAKILQTDVFKVMVSVIWEHELKLTEESANNITTSLFNSMTGGSQLEGQGTQGSLTGKHYDYIFTDDIVTMLDRISRAERERIKLFYQELQNIKNRGGFIRNTGTPWHKDDAFQLMPPARKYDCYSTGLISKEELTLIRSKMMSALFAANYELRHIASDDVIFTTPQFTNQTESLFDGQCHIDARYSGKDKTAFTILKKHSNGRYTGLGKIWDRHVDECKGQIIDLIKRFRAGTLHLERNADKGYLGRDFERFNLPVDIYNENMNKYVKITTYLKADWSMIDWLEDETDKEYIDMITDYNEQASFDDAPDSAASLLRQMNNETSWGW